MAQSAPTPAPAAPAHACGANDVTLACMVQWSAPVGPGLAAARASLGGATKKSDMGDLNGLANRQAAAGSTVASGLVLPHTADAVIPSNEGGSEGLQVLHGDATGVTSTTAGSSARVPLAPVQDGWASMSVRAPHAETVVRGQINPAAKSCYESDPDAKSKRPGRLNILIKLTPTGEVDSVSVATNTGLSPSVATCITAAAAAARFAPPGANGATVRASFTFPAQEDVAPPAAPRALGAPSANPPVHAAHDSIAKADSGSTNAEAAHP